VQTASAAPVSAHSSRRLAYTARRATADAEPRKAPWLGWGRVDAGARLWRALMADAPSSSNAAGSVPRGDEVTVRRKHDVRPRDRPLRAEEVRPGPHDRSVLRVVHDVAQPIVDAGAGHDL